MNQHNIKTNSNCTMQGLSFCGAAIARTRRMVSMHDNPTTKSVTHIIQDEYNRKFHIDDYTPAGYHDPDSCVCFPAYVEVYKHKNGNSPLHT